MFNFKIFFAELIGTFTLTFFGARAGAGLIGVALAPYQLILAGWSV